ncbi:L,D-transpeptidase [Mesorhizobium sp. BAC0120]|nr:L,D-transpeptidase [Mesorhizobium sp. BAC0120]MDW6026341.1 L,D-transpeptidase [Mesorhizobium sp. BAC0120]
MEKFVWTLVIVPALLAGLPMSQAVASTGQDQTASFTGRTDSRSANTPPLLQLAQYGNVEVYTDQYGRRVIVDAFTGEVVGIERPGTYRSREEYRRMMRRRQLDRDPDFGYVNPDEDVPYRPRPYRNGRPVDEYQAYPGDGPDEVYPEAPQGVSPETLQAYPEEPGGPEIVTRDPIERRPLGNPTIENGTNDGGTIGSETGPGATQPGLAFGVRDDVAALQVLLDRKGASPGVIDGRFGSNLDKALAAYREITGDNLHSTDTAKIKADLAASGGDAFIQYTITPEDAAGPYVASVPEDYGAKAKLDRLSYTSVSEMLAERFHMDESYLKSQNPGANFSRPGTVIKVANTGRQVSTAVARIVADKRQKQVRAYDAAGKIVAAYPATIGSSDTPSPSGTHAVSRVAFDPEYTYNPKLNFKQGENDKILKIPPGPNGPVGSIWIALDKPTYGIHGTPEPSKIGKSESHGCVRLTNWDAAELAKLVKPGVPVEFVD